MANILLPLLAVFTIFCLVLGFLGLFAKSAPAQSYAPLVPSQSSFLLRCSTGIVTCSADKDCDTCLESREGQLMTCQNLNDGRSVCLPKTAAPIQCDKQHGGVLTWQGYSDLNTMEFGCLCSVPDYAGASADCSKINANICPSGTFSWDMTTQTTTAPDASNCQCNPGFVKMITNVGQKPFCVPEALTSGTNFYEKTATKV